MFTLHASVSVIAVFSTAIHVTSLQLKEVDVYTACICVCRSGFSTTIHVT